MTENGSNGRPTWRDVLTEMRFMEKRILDQVQEVKEDVDDIRTVALSDITELKRLITEYGMEQRLADQRRRDLINIMGGLRGAVLVMVAVGGLVLGILNAIS